MSEENESYRLALDFLEVAVIEWDFSKKTFRASPGYGKYAVSNYSPFISGINIEELTGVHSEDLARFAAFCEELSCDKSSIETTVRIKTKDGDYRWTNIDEEKKHLIRIMEKADLDDTTQFLNRAAFERFCDSKRGDPVPGKSADSLLVLEFKFEEEAPGYESIQRTERTAKALSETIRPWSRKEDRLARFGDNRFLICMHSSGSKAVLHERVNALRKALDDFERNTLGISVYLGATNCCYAHEKGYRAAYDQAETALNNAKESGERHRVFFLDKEGRHTSVSKRRRVFIRTFGFFEVFIDQKPVFFKTAKAKELLALLVDRRGGYLSTDEAISYLWEDEPANKVTRSRYRKVALRLKETLEEHGIADIIETVNHRRRIVMENVECDLFDYVSGKSVSNTFSGNYRMNYSWAEVSSAQLNNQYWLI